MKREFLRPLLITIILIAVYRLGILLPIPFLDAEGIKQQFDSSNPSFALQGDLSIFMLGIMPYVSAYILVEIFSLFIPFLKRLRSGDLKGRLKLKRISLVLALILAIYQANALVSGLKSMKLSNGNLVLNVSIFEHVFLVCVLVCGFCLLVVLCELISRFGIGHGISIIILSSICGKFISRLPVFLAQVGYGNLSSLIIPLIVICGLIAFAYVLLKTKISIPCYHEKDNTTVDYFQLNLAPSSRVALTYGAAIIILPLTLSSFWGTESGFANNFHPGTLGYKLSSIIFVIMFSYLLGWAFLHPRKRVSKMRARGWHIANMDTTAESFMLKRQFIYNLPWTFFLCLMVVVPSTLIGFGNIPFYLGGGSIPVIVAITLDLIDGFKFYQKDLLHPIKIAEFHDIYDANMIQNHMEAVGIKSYLRGYHHRLLYYFFGPYLDMSLIIDDQDKEQAQALIQDYYGGLGLVPNKQI